MIFHVSVIGRRTNIFIQIQTMLISDFKAKATATLKRVKQTGEPVLVTLRGEPLAEVVPVRSGGVAGCCLVAGAA